MMHGIYDIKTLCLAHTSRVRPRFQIRVRQQTVLLFCIFLCLYRAFLFINIYYYINKCTYN